MSAILKRARKIVQVASVPETRKWSILRAAALKCKACSLYRNATQTVFGEGALKARIVLIGEQPGDREDVEGRPFVGPAGKLLDRALEEAGISREKCYVTNAVKHFKWEPRGKRRLHAKPDRAEIAACRPWWQAELAMIHPEVLICLGSTAARAIFDREVKVTQERGAVAESAWCRKTLVTVHPSALLRVPDRSEKMAAYERFVADLRVATNQVR
jgi:uracil-DNA glycosylase